MKALSNFSSLGLRKKHFFSGIMPSYVVIINASIHVKWLSGNKVAFLTWGCCLCSLVSFASYFQLPVELLTGIMPCNFCLAVIS